MQSDMWNAAPNTTPFDGYFVIKGDLLDGDFVNVSLPNVSVPYLSQCFDSLDKIFPANGARYRLIFSMENIHTSEYAAAVMTTIANSPLNQCVPSLVLLNCTRDKFNNLWPSIRIFYDKVANARIYCNLQLAAGGVSNYGHQIGRCGPESLRSYYWDTMPQEQQLSKILPILETIRYAKVKIASFQMVVNYQELHLKISEIKARWVKSGGSGSVPLGLNSNSNICELNFYLLPVEYASLPREQMCEINYDTFISRKLPRDIVVLRIIGDLGKCILTVVKICRKNSGIRCVIIEGVYKTSSLRFFTGLLGNDKIRVLDVSGALVFNTNSGKCERMNAYRYEIMVRYFSNYGLRDLLQHIIVGDTYQHLVMSDSYRERTEQCYLVREYCNWLHDSHHLREELKLIEANEPLHITTATFVVHQWLKHGYYRPPDGPGYLKAVASD